MTATFASQFTAAKITAAKIIAWKIIAPWLMRTLAAALVSLAAVLATTALLGLAFLPSEMQTARPFSAVTHSLELSDSAAVSLVWSMPSGYSGGRSFYLALQPAHGCEAHFVGPELNVLALARGPAADQAVVGTWDGAIHLLDFARATTQPLCASERRDGIVALACSADGRCLVWQGAYELAAWDLERKCDRWRRRDVTPFGFVLSPDSQTAFIANHESQVLQIDLRSGETVRSLAPFNDLVIQVAVSASGDSLAVLGANGRLLVLDTRTGEALWEQSMHYFAHQGAARAVAFSPCGRLLVTSDHNEGNALVVWDAATGRRLRELRGHQRIVHGAEFATTGELRSWSADGTVRVWDPATGASLSITPLQPPLTAT